MAVRKTFTATEVLTAANTNTYLYNRPDVTASTATAYTATTSDVNKTLQFTAASAVTVTISTANALVAGEVFNVLRGQMSLVGPRPCLPNQKELVEEREKRGVFRVRPGITGLAQINEIDMSTPRKLARYDRLMIERINLRLYVKLIISTIIGNGRGDRVRT